MEMLVGHTIRVPPRHHWLLTYDTVKMAEAHQRLRDQAHKIRELAEEAVATGSSRTSASLAADMISQIPSEPNGHLLSTTTAQDRIRADVGAALTGKVDGYGPGRETKGH